MTGKRILTAVAALSAVLLTGCSAMKFIATGDEFRKICEDSGLMVADVRDQASTLGQVDERSLIDAYAVTDAEGTYTVYYLRFSDRKASEAFYADLAGRMDGEEIRAGNYATESETVGQLSRKIFQEDGRVIYAEGDTRSIDSLVARVTSGFDTGSKEIVSEEEPAPEETAPADVSGNAAETSAAADAEVSDTSDMAVSDAAGGAVISEVTAQESEPVREAGQ